jgi:ATP-binding cassette subfamily B multidrug efflux pump
MSHLLNLTRRYAFPYALWYAGGLLALGGTTWLSLRIPEVAQGLVDGYPGIGWQEALPLLLLGGLQMVVRSLSRIFMFWPGRKIEFHLKNDLFQSFLFYPLTAFDRYPRGQLLSHMSQDVGQIRAFYAFAVLQAANFCFLFTFLILHMWRIHPGLVLAVVGPLLATACVTRLASPRIYRLSLENQGALGDLTKELSQAFRHIPGIQGIEATGAFLENMGQKNNQVYRSYLRLAWTRVMTFPLAQFLTNLSYLFILFYGGSLILKGELTLGQLLAFQIYGGLLSFPLTALGFVVSLYYRAKAGAKTVGELLAQETEPRGDQPLKPLPSVPILRVQGLTFSYSGQKLWGKKGLTFEVKPGEILGISGRIGTGKSTLLHILSGLYPCGPGDVYFMGEDLSSLSKKSYRQQVGYGLQTPYLFSGTLRENLIFGLEHKNPSDQDLEEVLSFSAMDGDLKTFPHGLGTVLGEKGLRLSGGQKQRLALARIDLKDPVLWLLDDTTSAVDEKTEDLILEGLLSKKNQKKAIILVSHRPKTLGICDRILSLDGVSDAG